MSSFVLALGIERRSPTRPRLTVGTLVCSFVLADVQFRVRARHRACHCRLTVPTVMCSFVLAGAQFRVRARHRALSDLRVRLCAGRCAVSAMPPSVNCQSRRHAASQNETSSNTSPPIFLSRSQTVSAKVPHWAHGRGDWRGVAWSTSSPFASSEGCRVLFASLSFLHVRPIALALFRLSDLPIKYEPLSDIESGWAVSGGSQKKCCHSLGLACSLIVWGWLTTRSALFRRTHIPSGLTKGLGDAHRRLPRQHRFQCLES